MQLYQANVLLSTTNAIIYSVGTTKNETMTLSRGLITDLIAERKARKHQIESYLNELRGREPLTEFRDTDWLAMVDYITVHSKKDIRVTFKDGTEIKA